MKLLILVLGVFCCSTAVIFIKETSVHPVFLAALRLFVAVVALSPVFVRDYRRASVSWKVLLRGAWVPGLLLGVHFTSWILAGRMTYAANASLIVNLVPVVMPFLLWMMVKERVSRRELVGTGVAFGGMLLLAGADFHFDRAHFLGDVLCFASMLFFAIYLTVGKRTRPYESIWLYVVPIYGVAGMLCLVVTLFFRGDGVYALPLKQIPLVLGLGILPTVLGHSTLNWALSHMRGQIVSLVNMGQFIFAGTMAFFFRGEVPVGAFYPACVLVIVGAWIAMSRTREG